MEIYSKKERWVCICVFYSMLCVSVDGRVDSNVRLKSVSLGAWLVTEGGIKPSLFYGIQNNDLLDGTGLQFQSTSLGKYLCAEFGGGAFLTANRDSPSHWETFRLWRLSPTRFHFRVYFKQFVGLNTSGNGSDVQAVASSPGGSEIFEIERSLDDLYRVRIKASNGYYLQAKAQDLVTVDGATETEWGDDDPSVFIMTIAIKLRGDFQLINGYGPKKAAKVLKEHWNTYIVEKDFEYISKVGLNSVRIPVGWWTATDPNPPKPYIGGSLKVLDNAFVWAKKYGLKVVLDLHAAPGCQNAFEHTSTRDGTFEWGKTDENIQDTVNIIEFLTARYANNTSLYAVQLLNEPFDPQIPLGTLIKYYKAGYEAVRKHTSTAYVMLSNRLGDRSNPLEFVPLAKQFKRCVIDVHYYNIFGHIFENMTIEENINFINTKRKNELKRLTGIPNGPLIYVGEWGVEWLVKGATKEEYIRFANTQLKVFGQATFGWAYWTYKNAKHHWSFEWMVKNGYLKL